jgi:hypothetical protein
MPEGTGPETKDARLWTDRTLAPGPRRRALSTVCVDNAVSKPGATFRKPATARPGDTLLNKEAPRRR